MAAEAEKELSGLELLRQPATPALARYLNDLHSVIGFQAYLWRMIVKADYSHGDPTKFPKPGDPTSAGERRRPDGHSLGGSRRDALLPGRQQLPDVPCGPDNSDLREI